MTFVDCEGTYYSTFIYTGYLSTASIVYNVDRCNFSCTYASGYSINSHGSAKPVWNITNTKIDKTVILSNANIKNSDLGEDAFNENKILGTVGNLYRSKFHGIWQLYPQGVSMYSEFGKISADYGFQHYFSKFIYEATGSHLHQAVTYKVYMYYCFLENVGAVSGENIPSIFNLGGGGSSLDLRNCFITHSAAGYIFKGAANTVKIDNCYIKPGTLSLSESPVLFYDKIGTATILNGNSSVVVTNTQCTSDSIVQVTPVGNAGSFWVVPADGSFTIHTGSAVGSDIDFMFRIS